MIRNLAAYKFRAALYVYRRSNQRLQQKLLVVMLRPIKPHSIGN